MGGLVAVSEIAPDVLSSITDEAGPRGLETGFTEMDGMLNGLQNGNLIIIAARPSVGKTSLAMNIAEHVALALKVPTAVFSLEMNKSELVQRLMCSVANVHNMKVRQRMLSAEDHKALIDAGCKISAAPLHIDDSAQTTVMQIRAKARRMKLKHGLGLIVIDYVQLMDAPEVKESRQQQVAFISRSLKALAKDLDVPVIALSQLNRTSESREGHRPRMSETGSLSTGTAANSRERCSSARLFLHEHPLFERG